MKQAGNIPALFFSCMCEWVLVRVSQIITTLFNMKYNRNINNNKAVQCYILGKTEFCYNKKNDSILCFASNVNDGC